jgi:hypothetical protein
MERLYDHSAGGCRVANHQYDTHADGRRGQNHKHLQSHSKPLAQPPQLEQLQIDNALLVQVLSLNLDQVALFAKVGGCRSGKFGIVVGDLGGKGCGGRIEGYRALRGRTFSRRLALRP